MPLWPLEVVQLDVEVGRHLALNARATAGTTGLSTAGGALATATAPGFSYLTLFLTFLKIGAM